MKNSYLSILAFVIALAGFGEASARKELLPFGYFSREPWNASYLFVASEADALTEEWYAKDFDDSGWKHVKGPVSVATEGLPYYNTIWEGEYGVTYVRRHFNVSGLEDINDVFFYCLHDDAMYAYLNGVSIYSRNNYRNESGSIATRLSDEAKSLLVEGDNVLAAVVVDGGGSWAYSDFGLYGFGLNNATFDSYDGWTGDFNRTSSYGNYYGYKYGNGMSCMRELENMPAGVYRLTANACGMEYYDDSTLRLSHRNDDIPARIFINSSENAVPSAFSDPSAESRDYTFNVEGKYVPYYVEGASRLLEMGKYQCEVWAFHNPEESKTLTFGLKGTGTDDVNRWVAWDNVDLEYYSESKVTALLDSIVKLTKLVDRYPMEKTLLDKVLSLAENIPGAKDYESKSKVLADIMQYETAVRKSVNAYARLAEAQATLKARLDGASGMTSPVSVAEGMEVWKTVQAGFDARSYDNDGIARAVAMVNEMVRKLDFTYVDIRVDIPGSLGDSILKKVENFVDVKSIKLSGTLNDEDLSTIKSRLSQLREIDMTGVNMKSIPSEMFYRRSLIETIKLPSVLTTIGDRSFYECLSLSGVELPEGLENIGAYAFYGCRTLADVEFPETLSSMGENAFRRCSSLVRISLPGTLVNIPNYAFYEDSKLEEVIFSEGIVNIGYYAFNNCASLDNLRFPLSLRYIGGDAFAYNNKLSSIEFNEGLYQIADNAFYDCDSLKEVTLPSTLVLANQSPFDYCDNLVKVTCLSIEPPYMTDQIPLGVSMEGRELYVPAISVNIYKQTAGWDCFPTIKPIDYLPETISVLGNLRLTLPENMPSDYNPDVTLLHDMKGDNYWQYGSLTVNGEGMLSIKNFKTLWDPNILYDRGDREYNGVLTPNFCSLLTNSSMRADNVSVDMFIRNNIWNFVSFPFDVKVSDIVLNSEGSTSKSIRKYDGALRAAGQTGDTWVRVGDEETLLAGQGYIIQTSRYIGNNSQNYSGLNFKAVNNGSKNNIFRTDDAVVVLGDYPSEFAHNRGWNLIGNPYPCYYDTRFMDFSAPITVWNIRNNTYSAVSPIDDSYVLCPGEAFFVQCPVDLKEITFNKEGRQTNRRVRAMESAPETRSVVSDVITRHRINLAMTDGLLTDHTRVVVNDEASMNYEMDKDAGKFRSSDSSVPQLFSLAGGIEYAINERPLGEGVVALGIHAGTSGIFTISLEGNSEGYDVTLEDLYSGEKVNISTGNAYSFYSENGDYPDRFQLRLFPVMSGVGVIGSDDADEGVGEYYTIEGLKIKNPVKGGVYIRNGKKIILNK